MTTTLAKRAAATGNRPSGFDYLRILLALAVVAYHSVQMSYGLAAQDALLASPVGPLAMMILPMFFALSGYLVAGSLERSSTTFGFLALRALRIYPALAVDTLFCALILGPVFTTSSLGHYFSDLSFYKYLLNVTGHIHYHLPGVFLDNPRPERVNGQLWTVPFELECYVVLAILAVAGVVRRRWILFVVLAVAQASSIYVAMTSPAEVGVFTGRLLVLCFLSGVAIYFARDFLIWSKALAAVCAIASVLLLPMQGGMYVAPVLLAYLTVYLGLLNPPRSPLLFSGDYSYGIFLYGNPLQQSVAHFPDLREWYLSIAIALPATLILAVLSWRFVEKPALSLRRYIPQWEGAWGERLAVLTRSKKNRDA